MNYSVTKVKTLNGREGYGFSCVLLKNGKKVASCYDYGDGADIHIEWDNRTPAVVKNRNFEDIIIERPGYIEEAQFNDFVNSLPIIKGEVPEYNMFPSPHLVIEDLVNHSIGLKKISSMLKKSVIFKTPDNKILSSKPSNDKSLDDLLNAIQSKHNDYQILNKLGLEEVYNIFKTHNLIG